MTLKQMFDEVRMLYPERPRTQIIIDLNKMYRRFCERTRILRQRTQLSFAIYKESEDTDKQEFVFTLPANFYKAVEVISSFKQDWEVRSNRLRVKYISTTEDPLDIKYIAYPVALVNDADTPEMPEQFHDAIVVGVLLDYEARYRSVLQKAGWFKEEWNQYIREAIKYGNEMDSLNVLGSYAFTGKKTWFGRVALVAGVNTVTMTDIAFTSITSYVILINYGSVLVTEYDPNANLDQRTTTSFKVIATLDTTVDILVTGT